MMRKSSAMMFHWLPLFLYCALIFIQSSRPVLETIPDILFLDKLLHFFGYALLGVLFFRAFNTLSLRDNPRLLVFISILSTALYGLSDEIHQHFVPTRSADIWDLAADMLGGGVGVFIIHHASARRKRFRH